MNFLSLRQLLSTYYMLVAVHSLIYSTVDPLSKHLWGRLLTVGPNQMTSVLMRSRELEHRLKRMPYGYGGRSWSEL